MRAKFIAATALLMSAGSANAALVTFSTPINVPNNINGVYVNLLTGVSAPTTAAVPGWDFNAYGATAGLSFFWASGAGGVAATATGPYLPLTPGSVVSAAATFSTSVGAAPAAAFQVPGSHILGFRFLNESAGAINYGYLSISSGGATGFPATINGWTFENSGGAITVPGGATPAVPEPATWAMMLVGFGAMGAAMRRNRATTLRVGYAA